MPHSVSCVGELWINALSMELWESCGQVSGGCGQVVEKPSMPWEKISALMSCEEWWEALLFHELSMAPGELSMAFP